MDPTTAAATTEAAAAASQSGSQRRGPAIKIRRYGRNDFEKFDQETARGAHLCVGSATIGKVDIDCKYHWKKAQWGVLGNEETPAGIVYMDITFKQPHGYWLERASVFITLSEDMSSYALSAPRRSSTRARRSLSTEYAVQITEHYGPRFLTGTPTILAETKHDTFVPSVGAMGFEVGGIGRESTAYKHRVGQWVFKGTVCKPKGRDGLRTLEWELSENSLNPEQAHNQTYQTAFAFEHNKRPIFMRVEVQGKLRDRSRQMKHGLLKFSSTFSKKDHSTLTELDLGKHVEFKKSLDQVAKGLDMAMQKNNCERLPVMVRDPTPAQFMDDVIHENLPGQTQRPALQQSPVSEQWSPGGGDIQELEENLELQGHECRYVQDCAADPIAESLRQQLRSRVGSDIAAHIHLEEARRDSETSDGGGTTAVNSESASVKATAPPPEAIDQLVLEIVKIPALLTFMKFIATMLQWFSKPQRAILDPTWKVLSESDGHNLIDDARVLEGSMPGQTDEPKKRQRGHDQGAPGPMNGGINPMGPGSIKPKEFHANAYTAGRAADMRKEAMTMTLAERMARRDVAAASKSTRAGSTEPSVIRYFNRRDRSRDRDESRSRNRNGRSRSRSWSRSRSRSVSLSRSRTPDSGRNYERLWNLILARRERDRKYRGARGEPKERKVDKLKPSTDKHGVDGLEEDGYLVGTTRVSDHKAGRIRDKAIDAESLRRKVRNEF